MGATIAYMFQLHCYGLCFLRCTHPGHRMYMQGLALLLRDQHRCIIQICTCGRGFRGNPRPVVVFNSSSRRGTQFASNISKGFSFVDKVSVPISDNVKRNNMLAFANRPELMKQYTTSSKYAAVHGDISGIPNYKIMILNEWKLLG